jgi:hypothetical protein
MQVFTRSEEDHQPVRAAPGVAVDVVIALLELQLEGEAAVILRRDLPAGLQAVCMACTFWGRASMHTSTAHLG